MGSKSTTLSTTEFTTVGHSTCGKLEKNLPVILLMTSVYRYIILDGPQLACSTSDVNLSSNRGVGAACEKEHERDFSHS